MKRGHVYARRRAFLLGLPAAGLGLAVYAPNAVAANGGTFLGLGLMVATALGAVADWNRAEAAEEACGAEEATR